MGGLIGQSTPTPVAADGLLYLATGSQGESNRPVFAVRPGASGDITLAKGEESERRSSRGSIRARRRTPRHRSSIAGGCTWSTTTAS